MCCPPNCNTMGLSPISKIILHRPQPPPTFEAAHINKTSQWAWAKKKQRQQFHADESKSPKIEARPSPVRFSSPVSPPSPPAPPASTNRLLPSGKDPREPARPNKAPRLRTAQKQALSSLIITLLALLRSQRRSPCSITHTLPKTERGSAGLHTNYHCVGRNNKQTSGFSFPNNTLCILVK